MSERNPFGCPYVAELIAKVDQGLDSGTLYRDERIEEAYKSTSCSIAQIAARNKIPEAHVLALVRRGGWKRLG